jgi:hypothetical protein
MVKISGESTATELPSLLQKREKVQHTILQGTGGHKDLAEDFFQVGPGLTVLKEVELEDRLLNPNELVLVNSDRVLPTVSGD